MVIKFQDQAAKVWGLLTSSDTYGAYRSAIVVTWNILKESLLLFWLLFCLLLVLIDWLWSNGRALITSIINWFSAIGEPSSANTIASEASKSIAAVSKTGLQGLFSQARTQLGLPERVEPQWTIPVPETPEPVPVAVVAPEPAAVATPEPIVAAPEPEPEPTPVEPTIAAESVTEEPAADTEEVDS